MAYSFTEKKRIRKSFAKRASVLQVPYLLATQIDSYAAFLQAERTAGQPQDPGAAGGFPVDLSRSPATPATRAWSSSASSWACRPSTRRSASSAGLTFASPLRAKVRLTIMDREAAKPTVKEVKEQEVYMGEIPLMTPTGSFVINGTERVIVSQLHRSPGVFFEHDRGKTHSSGQAAVLRAHHPLPRLLARLRVRSQGLRVFPRRPPPQDAGHHPAQGARLYAGADPAAFYEFDTFHLGKKTGIQFDLVPERLRGEIARFDIVTKQGKLIVPKDKRITVKHVREMEAGGPAQASGDRGFPASARSSRTAS